MNSKYKLGRIDLSSSEDNQKLGDTIKGIILGFSALFLFLAQKFGVPFTQTDIVTLATALGSSVSALVIVFGLLKKVVVSLTRKG